MTTHKFLHSVYLKTDLCNGCINCIKRCPTQAIRVRNGRAVITSQFCIDCGECIRICAHHAKRSHFDHPDIIKNYKYTVALPAPSLYSQFNNLDDINIVLTALIYMGFDDVYEVASAAEIVSEESEKYVNEHQDQWPFISTACPSVVRLIRVRFPNLIDHLLPKKPDRIAPQKVVPKVSLLFGHFLSEASCISGQFWIMLIVHSLPPKPPLSKGGGPRSGGGIQRHKVRIRLRFRRIRTICCESPAHKLLLAIYELPPLTRGPLSDYFNSHSLICMAFS